MGKRAVKFDTNAIFIEGQNDPVTRSMFLSSPLFPIFAAAYNRSEKFLRVGKINVDQSNQVSSSIMVSPEGLVVGKLQMGGGHEATYSFHTSQSPSSDGGMYASSITSTNPKYVQAKLSNKSQHQAAEQLDRRIRDVKDYLDDCLRRIADNLVDKNYGGSVSCMPTINVGDDIPTMLARIVMGEATLADMPKDDVAKFQAKYDEFVKSRTKFQDAVKAASDFFVGGKWVLCPAVNNGVVFGSINTEAAIKRLDTYSNGGFLPHKDFYSSNVPLKWYPDYESIPDEYREQLDYQLMVLKVHRNSNDKIPVPQSLFNTISDSVGAAQMTGGGNILFLAM